MDKYGKAFNEFVQDKKNISLLYGMQICPENSISPGYVTEKLVEAWGSGNVPIWEGIDRDAWINQDAIINLTNKTSQEILQILSSLDSYQLQEIRSRNIELLNFLENFSNFELVKGIDGSKNRKDLERVDSKKSLFWVNRELSNGEIACAMGHREMIMRAHINNAKIALFIEDDANLPIEEIETLKQSILNHKAPKALILSYQTETSTIIPIFKRKHDEKRYVRSFFVPTCAQMYAMNHAAIENVAAEWSTHRIETPADFPPWYADCLDFYFQIPGVNPNIFEFSSKIGNKRFEYPNSGFKKRFLKFSLIAWLQFAHREVGLKAYVMYCHGRAFNTIILKIKNIAKTMISSVR